MDFSLQAIWEHTGLFARFIIFTLGAMSIASLVVIAERMVVFRKARSDSRTFASKMGAILAKGDLTTAAEANLGKDVAVESVARALERQAQREVQSMKRGLGILATVGSTAPFVGLLGTTMGIVNAFQEMAKSGAGGLATISAGIAEALITTAFGLLVAIPAVMAYNFLQGWVDARSVDISESSNEFLDVVARNMGSSGSGVALDKSA